MHRELRAAAAARPPPATTPISGTRAHADALDQRCASPAPITIPSGDRQEREAGLAAGCSRGSPARRATRSRTSRRAPTRRSSIATFGAAERAHPEDAEPDQRRPRAQLDHDERAEQRDGERARGRASCPTLQPYVLRLDDRVDEHEQAGGDGDRAGDVDASRAARRARRSGRSAARAATAAMPIGRLMKKTQRHESVSVSRPPSSRPTAPPPAAIALQTPSAFVRSAPSANVVVTIDERGRRDERGAEALQRAAADRASPEVVREAVEQRRAGEDDDAGDEQPLRARAGRRRGRRAAGSRRRRACRR